MADEGESVLLEEGKSATSHPTNDAIQKVGTRGVDAFKVHCVDAGRTFEEVETAALSKGLRPATKDELQQLDATGVHSRLRIERAGAWIGKIDTAEYWVYMSERKHPAAKVVSRATCSTFAPPGVQADIVKRMTEVFGAKPLIEDKVGLSGPSLIAVAEGWTYVGQRSSFPSFSGGAAADLFQIRK